MDLIGLLPKSSCGHAYVLVIIDYATRYPEAVLLCKTTSQIIVHELVLLFSWVGISGVILMDQGTPFVSWLIQDLFQLLHV